MKAKGRSHGASQGRGSQLSGISCTAPPAMSGSHRQVTAWSKPRLAKHGVASSGPKSVRSFTQAR